MHKIELWRKATSLDVFFFFGVKWLHSLFMFKLGASKQSLSMFDFLSFLEWVGWMFLNV